MTQTYAVMYNPNSGPISAISTDLIPASEDLPQKRPKIWGKSLARAEPKLWANKRDIERPDSCFGRHAAETPADLVQVTGELFITRRKKEGKTNMLH